ncbi:MAG: hypothetical protein CMP95_02845 [Gammaproteobacteria bacterium]|nr:hypothetical protein [Gammaproteobacteria bacterium]|tara:strand:+ start:16040 stop:16333 length:294 start_codon:yes stop_codon:yes gene_type:complete
MSNADDEEQTWIMAALNCREYTLLLYSDGYWRGADKFHAQEEIANSFACWQHWTPDKGDAAIWACEEVVKILPGKITAFFTPADMGNPLERSETITP